MLCHKNDKLSLHISYLTMKFLIFNIRRQMNISHHVSLDINKKGNMLNMQNVEVECEG